MNNHTITKAETWEQINEAAQINSRCIRDGGMNGVKARQTWDVFGDTNVLYYLISNVDTSQLIGYLRLLLVSGTNSVPKTWVVDFVGPSDFNIVAEVAKLVDGVVLVKIFSGTETEISKTWPRLCAQFPKLDQYPYHQAGNSETTWMVVPRIEEAEKG